MIVSNPKQSSGHMSLPRGGQAGAVQVALLSLELACAANTIPAIPNGRQQKGCRGSRVKMADLDRAITGFAHAAGDFQGGIWQVAGDHR